MRPPVAITIETRCEPGSGKSKMNELHGYFYSVLAALPLLLSACSESHSQGGPPPPPEVSVAAVIERQVNESDEFTGRLAAVERVEVRPRVTGYVERVYFQDYGLFDQKGLDARLGGGMDDISVLML